jgi:hypothetical protein
MMSLLLDSSFVSSDEDFNYACNDSEARLFVENLWNRYWEYSDKDFAKKIQTRFHGHFWEMYLACSLKDNGNNLLPKTKWKGPDIEIESTDFSRIWVEAIAASPGSGEDRIPLPKLDDKMMFRVPEEQIVLRYTTAIDAKYRKYIQYTNNENGNVIEKSEPYIIAVNCSKVPYAWDLDDEIPYIVQAVLPFGLPNLEINWGAPKESTAGYNNRPEIKKVSGEGIPTNIFFRKEYEGISGIIFSRVNIRQFHGKMGRDFLFVHNPLALNKLPEGWLGMGREYRVEGNFLECRRWLK